MYTDAEATTGASTAVEFTDPTGQKREQSTATKGNQGETLGMEGTGVTGILMTDNYFSETLDAALVADTAITT